MRPLRIIGEIARRTTVVVLAVVLLLSALPGTACSKVCCHTQIQADHIPDMAIAPLQAPCCCDMNGTDCQAMSSAQPDTTSDLYLMSGRTNDHPLKMATLLVKLWFWDDASPHESLQWSSGTNKPYRLPPLYLTGLSLLI